MNREYEVRGEVIVKYLTKDKQLMAEITKLRFQNIPREENSQDNALSKLASSSTNKL